MATKFTELHVKNLKPRATRYEVTDSGCRGLTLRVSPAGHKTWSYVYRRDGRLQRVGLGNYPAVTLKAARDAADAERAKLNADRNPAEEARRRRQSPTFETLADDYKETVKGRWGDEAKRYLDRDIIPEWKHKKVHKIARRDVLALVEDKAKDAPVAANRMLAVIRRVFNWALERELVEVNPATRMKAPAKEHRRDRVLSADEIKTVWSNLDKIEASDSIKDALRLILVTAQRPGEVLAMRREEIDGDWWTIPGEKTKNSKPQRVPLTPLAREIIKRRPEAGPLFPSPRHNREHIEVNALAHAVRRNRDKLAVEPFKPHDLRRTAASNIAANGTDRITLMKILNHADQAVTGVYDVYGYDTEKQDALRRWDKALAAIIKGKPASVKRLRRSA